LLPTLRELDEGVEILVLQPNIAPKIINISIVE